MKPLAPGAAEPDFRRLKEYLISTTGLAYYESLDEDLAGRIGRRLEKVGARGYGDYLQLLSDPRKGATELDALIGELTIGETYFFRQSEHFQALARITIPDLVARNESTRRLRIWSAGCATGAEPYSVAILLEREFGSRLAGWDVSILATDINREFLARARVGRFDAWAFRATPEEVQQSCFHRRGRRWELAPEFRKRVTFEYHNLVQDPFPAPPETGGFDLILCRNVMIYFSREVIRGVAAKLHDSLVEGGWLLVGHAELNVEVFRSFRTVSTSGGTLYQRVGEAAEPVQPPAWAPEPAIPAPPEPEPAIAPDPVPLPPPAETPQPEAPAPDQPAGIVAEMSEVQRLANRGDWDAAAAACRALLERDGLNPVAHFSE